MDSIALMVIVFIAALGYCGLIIWAYNSINATGLRRTTIKLIEKLILLCGLIVPVVVLILEIQQFEAGVGLSFGTLHLVTKVVLFGLCIVAVFGAPFWIESRPVFSQAKDRSQQLMTQLRKPKDKGAIFRGRKFSTMGKLPFNEIGWMEVNHKKLLLDNLPDPLAGLTIAHISDIHLTGQMDHGFYRQAFEWLQERKPDLIVLSGDIVDYDRCVEEIEVVFADLKAPLGKFFVLGNHDRRLKNPIQVSEKLVEMGWDDTGRRHSFFQYRGLRVRVIGNELPWFQRFETDRHVEENACWTLGIAHSPDQLGWGVSMGCGLLLCGHTHGGQIRFPWIGPIIAPSWHGTRYASGVFERSGTLMHVSRGMSGIHPYRWGCPPEVSFLQLAAATSSKE